MPTVQSEYAPFGVLVDPTPLPVELTAAARAAAKQADSIDEAAVVALLGITPAEAAAAGVGFPEGRLVTATAFSLWHQKQWPVWSRAAIVTWRSKVIALARALDSVR